MARDHVTKGEQLYHFMCTKIKRIPEVKALTEIGNYGRRTTKLLEFVDGSIRFHAFARIIQFGRWTLDREDLELYEDKVSELRRLCLEMLEIGEHNCDDLNALFNYVFDAARQIGKKINESEKRAVREDYKKRKLDLNCYMCDGRLDISADQYRPGIDFTQITGTTEQIELLKERTRAVYNPIFVEYDHVWPRSLGGDSTADNLLPICPYCNREKANIVSWEWALVQSAVWPPLRGNSNVLDNITKQIRIALHLLAAMRAADTFGLSLKSAFLHVGPRQSTPRVNVDDDTSDFFNMEVHDQSKLDSLWE